MNTNMSALTADAETCCNSTMKVRRAGQSNNTNVFADIYDEETNIAVWQRSLSDTLQKSIETLLTSKPTFKAAMTVTPESALSSIRDALGGDAQTELSENITELVDMFCTLFELERVGLRLTALDRAMCPRFHVDQVPCRLVTTFKGIATEWLPQQTANRDKLGAGSNGKPDSESGLYKNGHDIQQLNSGDVALLKGERWEGNENAGLVHRSPNIAANERRLLLTLDFSH